MPKSSEVPIAIATVDAIQKTGFRNFNNAVGCYGFTRGATAPHAIFDVPLPSHIDPKEGARRVVLESVSKFKCRLLKGLRNRGMLTSVDEEIEQLVVRMARENTSWGYDRMVGAMANLGYKVSDQTVGNILRRHDIPPAPKRKRTITWKDFIRAHMAVMVGTDFFTVEVLTLRGLKTFYVLFFLHLESRRIYLAGVTRHPDQEWMEQMARNVTMEGTGFLANCRYLPHDRDSKYCASFRELIAAENVKVLALPPKSPNLNAFAERWVRSVKEECLSKLILFGERSLKRALHLRPSIPNHQKLRCQRRLGGLLKYYECDVA